MNKHELNGDSRTGRSGNMLPRFVLDDVCHCGFADISREEVVIALSFWHQQSPLFVI